MTPIMQQPAPVAVPKTRAELDALVLQRSELGSQLANAEARRGALNEQMPDGGPEQRATLARRQATLDARVEQLEGRIRQLDEAILAGMANPEIATTPGAPQVISIPTPPTPPMPPEAFVHVPPFGSSPPGIHPEIVISGILGTLSLMVLVSWVTWKRAVRRFGRNAFPAAPEQDVARLQQSVDTIALEVERISEAQRFLTKVLSERAPVPELAGRRDPDLGSSR